MNTGSLGARIALLFAACTMAVSLVAGVLFSHASQAHFLELDQEVLVQRANTLQPLLAGSTSPAALAQHLPAVRGALAQQAGLALRVRGPAGEPWFSSQPGLPTALPGNGLSTLSSGSTAYRSWATPMESGVTLELLLDVTHHQHFLEHVQRLIWLTMALAAIATAVLGAWAARRALAPLRRMGEVASSVSANSLGARLPTLGLPREIADVADTFNGMLERLEAAFARLSGFSADIAHELRTPLNNLLTRTQVTLAQPRDLHAYREALHGNLDELQRLAQLVNDMLLLAKGDHGLLQPGLASLALEREVAALLEYYQLLADESGVELRCSGQALARADRGLLRRALANLLENALRFTPPGGRITVSIGMAGQQPRVAVHNTGPNIAQEHLARLFERFYRASAGGPHAGLGLAITRSIAQAHGGGLAAHNTANGPCFELALGPYS